MRLNKSILFIVISVILNVFIIPPKKIEAQTADAETTVVYSHETSYTTETSCQVNCKAILPDNFTQNCVVNISNNENQIYQVILYSINNHAGRIFLSPGSYSVNIQVADESSTSYTLEYPDRIDIKADEVFLIEATLMDNNMDSKQVICDICGALQDENGTCQNENCERYENDLPSSNTSNEKIQDPDKVFLEHNGTGTSSIYSIGTQLSEYNIIIEIVKSGYPSIAEYIISLDGGATFSETRTVPLSGAVVLDNTGLTLIFEGFYTTGDNYTAKYRDISKEVTVKNAGDGNATVELLPIEEDFYTYDIMCANKYCFSLEIRKGGILGNAVFVYSLDSVNYSEEMHIPTTGEYIIPDTGLKIIFHATENEPFVRGDIYTLKLTYPANNTNSSFYVTIFVILLLLMIGYFFLLSKRKKDSDYNLQTWHTPEI